MLVQGMAVLHPQLHPQVSIHLSLIMPVSDQAVCRCMCKPYQHACGLQIVINKILTRRSTIGAAKDSLCPACISSASANHVCLCAFSAVVHFIVFSKLYTAATILQTPGGSLIWILQSLSSSGIQIKPNDQAWLLHLQCM